MADVPDTEYSPTSPASRPRGSGVYAAADPNTLDVFDAVFEGRGPIDNAAGGPSPSCGSPGSGDPDMLQYLDGAIDDALLL